MAENNYNQTKYETVGTVQLGKGLVRKLIPTLVGKELNVVTTSSGGVFLEYREVKK
ncbi:MAG: hypothetical protein AABW63_01315 [Nanoarchaeota archaeon]